ncbi:MAG: hypothetical protein WBC55_05915 [Dehalococcoidia bacterium]
MKWRTLIPVILLALVLFVASACGGGGAEATPTPTPTPTQTSTPTVTPTPTPTPEATEYPPPSEGKGNLAGHITWDGKSWRLEHGKQAGVQLFTKDAYQELGEYWTQIGAPEKRGAADVEGYFLFKNIDPGLYLVKVKCPTTSKFGGILYGPVEVTADETTSMGEIDPFDDCTRK